MRARRSQRTRRRDAVILDSSRLHAWSQLRPLPPHGEPSRPHVVPRRASPGADHRRGDDVIFSEEGLMNSSAHRAPDPVLPHDPRAARRLALRRRRAPDRPRARGTVRRHHPHRHRRRRPTSSSTASAPKRRTHSAPTLTTRASTSRSTPTSPPPFTAAPRARLLPDLPVDPRAGTRRRHPDRIDGARHHRTRPPACRRRRSLRRPPGPRGRDGDATTRQSTISSPASTGRPPPSAGCRSPPPGPTPSA